MTNTDAGPDYRRTGSLLQKKYKEFFFPTLLATISTSLSIIVDSMVVGNLLGPAQMAGVNLCMPVLQAIFTLSLLIGMGASILIAASLGRRDRHGADRYFTSAILITLCLGLLISAVAIPLTNSIASLLTPDPKMAEYVTEYLRILFSGIILVMIVPVGSYLLRADGAAKTSSVMLIVANISNLLLDLVFIGCFEMGVGGSALATVIGYVLGLTAAILYLRSPGRGLHLVSLGSSPGSWLSTLGASLKQFVITGGPSGLSSALMTVKIFFINTFMAYTFGNQGLVVFTVCLSLMSFASMFIGGTGGTMVPIIGALYGERDFRGIRMVFRYALTIAVGINALMVVVFENFPVDVLKIFGVSSPELLAFGIPSIRIFAISQIGMTVSYIFIYYYMAIQRRFYATILSVLEGAALVIPLVWIMSELWGVSGLWLAFTMAEALSLAILFSAIWLRRCKDKYPGVMQIPENVPEVVYDVSIAALTSADAANVSEESMRALAVRGIDKEKSLRTAIAIEEIIENIRPYRDNARHKIGMDIRITETGDELTISIRDNGVHFNHTDYRPEEECGEFSISGITILRKIASDISYTRVIGLNQTVIIIKNPDIS